METYLPYRQRTPDSQYRDLLATIVAKGIYGPTRQGVPVWTLLGHVMHFDLSNGFPIINERSIRGFWRTGINELGAFINGARNYAELAAVGASWWEAWTQESKTAKRGLEPGDIGPGSYGAAFHDFPKPDGTTFDQWAEVFKQIKTYPDERRHLISPWIPFLTYRTEENPNSSVTIAPCHGWVYFRILGGRLNLVHVQRSADVPVGVPSNMMQYGAMTLFMAHLMNLPVGQYVHMFIDAHIYEDQVDNVRAMLLRDPRPLGTVTLNAKGRKTADVHDFTGDLFELSDYDPHPAINGIPVAT